METRLLGKTGLSVSVLSQGGAAFGEQYGKLAPGQVDACVRRAIDAGINLFDTSPYYGLTTAETALGEALQGSLRKQIYLCSKAGRNGRKEFDFTPQSITKSVDASLIRLKTDYLDILLAHDIEFASDYEPIFTDTAECLHRLKEKGKCRFIGMSGYPLGILKQAIENCNLDVVISYAHHTMQNTRLLSELLPIAESHGVGILNASPLSLGLLTNQGPPDWHPAPKELKERAKQAAQYCSQRGIDIAYLGMQFCLSESAIPSTITGTAKVEELEINLKALNSKPDPLAVQEVQALFGEWFNFSWPSGNWK
jgi:L-galactose dehydrogenase